MFQGVYRLAGVRTTWEQGVMAGCLAAGPDAVASHRSAAALHGMPGAPRWVEVMVPRPHQVRVEGVIAHRTRLLASEDVGRPKGIPATTPARTIADLARIYPATKVGPMLDYALARRLVTRAQLEARATGRKHDDILRELLDERPATAWPMGSEFEACLFRALREAGLPLPVAQYRVLMPDGGEVFLDFAYPDVLLAIEADSYLWHASLARLAEGPCPQQRARGARLVDPSDHLGSGDAKSGGGCSPGPERPREPAGPDPLVGLGPDDGDRFLGVDQDGVADLCVDEGDAHDFEALAGVDAGEVVVEQFDDRDRDRLIGARDADIAVALGDRRPGLRRRSPQHGKRHPCPPGQFGRQLGRQVRRLFGRPSGAIHRPQSTRGVRSLQERREFHMDKGL